MLLFCAAGGSSQAGINGGGGLWRATGSTFYDAINNAWMNGQQSRRPALCRSVMAPPMVLPVETPEMMTPGRWMTASCILPRIGHCIWWGWSVIRAWLTQHAAQLNAMECGRGWWWMWKSENGLQALQALAQGGLLSPTTGTDLAPPSSVITLPSSDHGNRVDPAGEVMLPPIWPSDGVDSPAFWLAVLMWCVFFVVIETHGGKNQRPARRHRHCHGKESRVPEKRKPSESSTGLVQWAHCFPDVSVNFQTKVFPVETLDDFEHCFRKTPVNF